MHLDFSQERILFSPKSPVKVSCAHIFPMINCLLNFFSVLSVTVWVDDTALSGPEDDFLDMEAA